MARTNPRNLDSKVLMKYLDLLWTSIAELKSRDEVKNFFKDLLSKTESVMLARRILIAQMLLSGKGYDEIKNEMKTSHATIANVQRWLESGFGGYEKAVENFEKAVGKRLKKYDSKTGAEMPYSFGWLRKKYPIQFLLFNLLSNKD
jgi:TrpR-related protein YerC/YecD